MQDYKQFLFSNERVLPSPSDDLKYPLEEKIIAENVIDFPKVAAGHLIFSNTKKEVIIRQHATAKDLVVALPSKKKALNDSDMELVVSDNNALVYLHGQVFTVSIPEHKLIDQATVFSTNLDTKGCLYPNQITYDPDLTSFGIFDLLKKEPVWKTILSNYCVKTCGSNELVIVQDGLFLIRAFDKSNGNELWSVDVKKILNYEQYFMGINSVIALYKSKLILGSNDQVFCLDSQTGDVVWLKKLPGFNAANMSVFGNGIISSISATAYYEIDAQTGNTSNFINIDQITRDLDVTLFTKPVLTKNQVIVFSAMNSRLFIFSRKDFKLTYQLDVFNTNGKRRYQPAISAGQTSLLINNSIFTVDMDGIFREYK